MKASIIIPVYNQIERLAITLTAFSKQTIQDSFEVVVVDDGSLPSVSNNLSNIEGYDLKIVEQPNKGRAIARNIGVQHSKNDLLIFCDGDRVPGEKFVETHVMLHNRMQNIIVIGQVREVYISNLVAVSNKFSNVPDLMFGRSKIPAYPRAVYNLYDETGKTDSGIPWTSTFSGNMSLPKRTYEKVGGFCERFKNWGFEHFEFGYKLYSNQTTFLFSHDAVNFHLAHTRDIKMLELFINESFRIMNEMYPDENSIIAFKDFVLGKKTLQDIEINCHAKWLGKVDKPVSFSVGQY